MKEEWKSIEGYEEYIVSNTGKVISLKYGKSRLLKTESSRKYPCVSLSRGNKVWRVFIHVLVARLFLPNPEGKPEINHIDGDKLNPSVDNLEWCTRSENQIHAFATGLQGRGETMHGAKRTDEQVKDICKLISDGLVRGEILKLCPYMSKACFDHIRTRRRWTHISCHYNW